MPMTWTALPLTKCASCHRELLTSSRDGIGRAYPVQGHRDDSIGINGGLLATELGHFAYNRDEAAREVVEVRGGDAR